MKPIRHHLPTDSACGLNRRAGFSLFEVVISLGLFIGALAALSQLSSNGMNAAVQSRLLTHAVLRCESKLNEIAAAVEPMQPINDLPFEDDPNWNWSLQSESGPHADLLLVTVTVKYRNQNDIASTSFSMSRLMRDPLTFQTVTEPESTGTAP